MAKRINDEQLDNGASETTAVAVRSKPAVVSEAPMENGLKQGEETLQRLQEIRDDLSRLTRSFTDSDFVLVPELVELHDQLTRARIMAAQTHQSLNGKMRRLQELLQG